MIHVNLPDLVEWIESIHVAVMETRTLEDFEALNTWWNDVVQNGITIEKEI